MAGCEKTNGAIPTLTTKLPPAMCKKNSQNVQSKSQKQRPKPLEATVRSEAANDEETRLTPEFQENIQPLKPKEIEPKASTNISEIIA